MSDYRQISDRQWFYWLALSSICLTPFGLPTVLYGVLDHSAWVPVFAAFGFTVWNCYLAIAIGRSCSGQSLPQWSAQLMGRWVGALYSIAAIIVMYMWGLLMLYEFMALLVYTQLPHSVRFFPLSFLIVACFYLLSRGLEGWIRWGELWAIPAIIGLIFINAPQFANASFAHLLPLGDLSRRLSRYGNPNVIASLFIFRGVFVLYFIFPYLNNKNKLMRWSVFGIAIAAVEILLSIVLPLAIFGGAFAGKLSFPYQESLSTVSLTFLPIERITLLTPIVWQVIIVYVLIFSTFCTVEGVRTLIKSKKDKPILYTVGILTFSLGLYHPREQLVMDAILYWSLAGLIVFSVIPTLIWIILMIRRRIAA